MTVKTRDARAQASAAPESGEAAAYRLEDQVGFLVRRVHQRATGIFSAVMADFDITPTQFAVLAKLDDLGAVSQNELGRLAAMDPATTWGVVSRLIKRNLVTQSPDPGDARLVILGLSAEGGALARAMKRRGAEVSRATLEGLSTKEAETLLALLRRLV
ncbi:MAG TPA: MarR family transcriptional regulator [Methylomirabilota bacterium]|nr:MarR family transcriptional regulator [Methylomirabilota bacterium]